MLRGKDFNRVEMKNKVCEIKCLKVNATQKKKKNQLIIYIYNKN